MQPFALVLFGIDVPGSSAAAFNGQVALYRYYRYAPHNVNAELQAFAVQVICQRFKPFAAGSGREAVHSRLEAPVFIYVVGRVGFVVTVRFVV
ncbi:hypothetical protein GCM10009415_38640 [Chitinophaga japonensis]